MYKIVHVNTQCRRFLSKPIKNIKTSKQQELEIFRKELYFSNVSIGQMFTI